MVYIYSKSTYDRLHVAYNMFRALLQFDRRGSISTAFVDNNVYYVNVHMRKDIFSFRNRIYTSDNKLIGVFSHPSI